MLRTISLGTCVSVQGLLERHLPDGRIVVKVGNTAYTGTPVSKQA
ncbi:hypothetical protein [Cognatishimia sp. F0-27]|nr:hypothetical protein [Cognatishimia sp. F0-27]